MLKYVLVFVILSEMCVWATKFQELVQKKTARHVEGFIRRDPSFGGGYLYYHNHQYHYDYYYFFVFIVINISIFTIVKIIEIIGGPTSQSHLKLQFKSTIQQFTPPLSVFSCKFSLSFITRLFFFSWNL